MIYMCTHIKPPHICTCTLHFPCCDVAVHHLTNRVHASGVALAEQGHGKNYFERES